MSNEVVKLTDKVAKAMLTIFWKCHTNIAEAVDMVKDEASGTCFLTSVA